MVLVHSKRELDSTVELARNMVLVVDNIVVLEGSRRALVDNRRAPVGSKQELGSIAELVRSRLACSDFDRKVRLQKLLVPTRKRRIQGTIRFFAWMGLR